MNLVNALTQSCQKPENIRNGRSPRHLRCWITLWLKHQSLITLWKLRLEINDAQGLILLSDSWCVDLASCTFCWHSRVFLHEHFPPVSYIPKHSRYCIWKTKQEIKYNYLPWGTLTQFTFLLWACYHRYRNTNMIASFNEQFLGSGGSRYCAYTFTSLTGWVHQSSLFSRHLLK